MLDENIRLMRKEKGLTQEQLAEVMGVSTASVSKWETGLAAPELTMLAALADFFEMSIDALIGHTVDKAQLDAKVKAIHELSLAAQDEQAMEQAEELLRRYPNEYEVVECGVNAYYAAYVHNAEKEKMHRCMELVHRKYSLSKDTTGKKWFELHAELANCYGLLGEWEKAKEYYEESNVAGVNDNHLAQCLARMGETGPALEATSKVIKKGLFHMMTNISQMAELWQEKEEPEKASAVLRWGLDVIEGSGCEEELKTFRQMFLFSLAMQKQEQGETEEAKEYIRRAVRVERGTQTGQAEEKNVFLVTEKPLKVIQTKYGADSQIIAWLTAMGEEELLAAAKEELE